ncbi:MAG TPA: glutathione S-transferase family protein [Allosphingosinicella sp.]|nr:glutathione S-transferase family protein [Allosphingosinicella sp.]
MIECWCAPTPNSRRVTMTLEECGLPYVRHEIDLTRRAQRDPDFMATVNPAGAVPVIRESEGPDGRPFTLTQSAAICLYLSEKTGLLLPASGTKRAEALQWFAFGTTDLGPVGSSLYRLSLTEQEGSKAVAMIHERLFFYCERLDARLRARAYLADDFSLADIATYPILISHFVDTILAPVPGFEAMRRWMAEMAARPAIQRGL